MVTQQVLNLVKRLSLEKESMGFHYYEWDTLGNKVAQFPDDNACDNTKGICGFDTHYPDYFPVRMGFE